MESFHHHIIVHLSHSHLIHLRFFVFLGSTFYVSESKSSFNDALLQALEISSFHGFNHQSFHLTKLVSLFLVLFSFHTIFSEEFSSLRYPQKTRKYIASHWTFSIDTINDSQPYQRTSVENPYAASVTRAQQSSYNTPHNR